MTRSSRLGPPVVHERALDAAHAAPAVPEAREHGSPPRSEQAERRPHL